jgi:hypothetical protein
MKNLSARSDIQEELHLILWVGNGDNTPKCISENIERLPMVSHSIHDSFALRPGNSFVPSHLLYFPNRGFITG